MRIIIAEPSGREHTYYDQKVRRLYVDKDLNFQIGIVNDQQTCEIEMTMNKQEMLDFFDALCEALASE